MVGKQNIIHTNIHYRKVMSNQGWSGNQIQPGKLKFIQITGHPPFTNKTIKNLP